jgi:hypothetical protein
MKKTILIIIFQVFLQQGFPQNQFVAKMVIVQDQYPGMLRSKVQPHTFHQVHKIIFSPEAQNNTALFINDHPVITINGNTKRSMLLLTELSFSDVLETSMNSIKNGLVNTYDDHISELFKDAPSLVKLKFILPL